MLASYLLDATRSSHPLEELALEHAGYKALSEKTSDGRGAKAISFRAIGWTRRSTYAGERADLRCSWRRAGGHPRNDASRRSIASSRCR